MLRPDLLVPRRVDRSAIAEARGGPSGALDDGLELDELPAAVVCARCGGPACGGCEPVDEPTTSSLGLVPWEHEGAGAWRRLWATTRASTEGAEAFFAAMPHGSVAAALRFAVLAELLAVGSSVAGFFAMGLGLFFVVFPALTRFVLSEPETRATLLRAFVAAWGAFTAVLVAAHGLHGAMLDAMARASGARGAMARALRFGLYAAGWDVATSPVGVLVALGDAGLDGLRATSLHAFRTPGASTGAMLRGLYGLEGARAAKVRGRAMALTMVGSVLGIAAACVAVVLAL